MCFTPWQTQRIALIWKGAFVPQFGARIDGVDSVRYSTQNPSSVKVETAPCFGVPNRGFYTHSARPVLVFIE